MADHDQKADKKMGQNDKNLIQDVAMEVKDKDKSKTQSQEDIEAKIEEGYIKLKGDINSRLTPLLQALTEAGVDGGVIASVEKEVHSNARMNFFNRVLNSDISNMEEIRKLVQKESFDSLKPIFEDGEINHDDIKISNDYTKDDLEDFFANIMDKPEENKEIKSDSKIDFNDPWLREDAEKLELINEEIKDVVEVLSDEEFDELNAAAIAGDSNAKVILVQLTTTLSYGLNGKAYQNMDKDEKEASLRSLSGYLTVCNMTNNPAAIKIGEAIINKLNISGIVKVGSDGSKTFDLEALKAIGLKDGIIIKDFSQSIEETGAGCEGFLSKEDLIEESQITSTGEIVRVKSKNLVQRYLDGEIDYREIEKLLDINLDASNRTLALWKANPQDDPRKIELFNKVVSHVMDKNLHDKDFKWTEYVVRDLNTSMDSILSESSIGSLDVSSLEKMKQVMDKCVMFMQKDTLAIGRDDVNILVEDLTKLQEKIDKAIRLAKEKSSKEYQFVELSQDEEEIKRQYAERYFEEEQPQFIVSPEYLEELDRQDAEREAQERDVTQITAEQKKANMLKAMTGMTKSKGLAKSQEWMDNLITNYPDKEIIAEAVVEFLEKQKETDEHFMDEDAKDSREAVFEAIVLSGIDNPELFERMQKVDRETSKVVVKNVIEQVNSSRSVLNNVVGAIQALGKNINEPEQEIEQEQIVEDKPLGFLNPDISNIDKPKMFGGNNARGEEPEDDWTR